MTTKELIFAANILLDCEEMTRAGMHPLLKYIEDRCKEYHIEPLQSHIIAMVGLCTPVYTLGTVSQEYNEPTST
jgi:hypothetical protein